MKASVHFSKKARQELLERSDGMCEAMARIRTTGVYGRCWMMPVEIHHMITRGRGGDILDAVNESYHLIALCSDCHRAADGGEAYAGSVLIEGYVTWNADRSWPVYTGPDPYLSKKYPRSPNARSSVIGNRSRGPEYGSGDNSQDSKAA